ncbi:MAG TPA: hypothetical protein VEH86_01555 [Candidatus Acidoferrum sp.]|nr:hypothetical protein [Candidatus Acidoferrum sp.]
MAINVRFDLMVLGASEYQTYVHNYLNSDTLGNWTYVEKPFFPVILNDSQVLIGQNWSIVVPLEANHFYHAYLYGKWVSNATSNKTAYDTYVYDPYGTLVGYHTPSAGLPPNLGSSPDDPFFVPEYTGNYTFTIANSAGESMGSQQATFMIIEDVQCNVWNQQYIEGLDDSGLPNFYTSWAYEFVTNSTNVEVYIKVPDTLDMYEARLYLMASPNAGNYTLQDGVPLAWEPGLYGNRTNSTGGYNTDSQGYEGQAYASCENYGQDMLIKFNSTPGENLYHLVLLGEKGYGNVSFLIRTEFDSGLQPSNNPTTVQAGDNATITYISQTTDLENAELNYSTDDWQTNSTVEMNIAADNRTCSQVIPAQQPGTIVHYVVEALDYMGDTLDANGSYVTAQLPITYVDKPMIPVYINESQIQIGQNWTIICPLQANHSYHIYYYGEWINMGPNPVTVYDVYVYDPTGRMIGYHTPAAGFPPHLGSTFDQPFFVPLITGNYTFVIYNDPRESNGTQQGTFMIIENVDVNVWHQTYIEGTDSDNMPLLDTSWAYEFATDSKYIEVYVEVPQTLDMYEARLYVMSTPSSGNQTSLNQTVLDGSPLAWEAGLYGNLSQGNNTIGGYNLESRGYRGNEYASCEYYGQDMYMNFTSPYNGTSLYHLVFIGQAGSGTINFLVKTEFNNSFLIPATIPEKAYQGQNVTVAYTSNSTDLENATLEYSTDGWKTENSTSMTILQSRNCTAVIPGQPAGTTIEYVVTADDVLENVLSANGSYPVKYASTLNFTQTQIGASPGDNVTIKGYLTPQTANVPIVVTIASTNESEDIVCYTLNDSTFSVSFEPPTVGTWIASARFNGTDTLFGSDSSIATVVVEEGVLAKYSLYIFGGIGALAMISVVLYVRRIRG